MKLTNDLLAKVGTDKMLHHLGCVLICAFVTIVLILWEGVINWSALLDVGIGAAAALLLSILKEKLDNKYDWKDIAWGMSGCLWVLLAVVTGVLLHQLAA